MLSPSVVGFDVVAHSATAYDYKNVQFAPYKGRVRRPYAIHNKCKNKISLSHIFYCQIIFSKIKLNSFCKKGSGTSFTLEK